MSEEEKEVIERQKNNIEIVIFNSNGDNTNGEMYITVQDLKILLNLIEKLQTSLNACENSLVRERQERIKLNKVIDLMAEVLTDCEFDDKCQNCTFECERDYDQLFSCNKEYFYKKVEKENE